MGGMGGAAGGDPPPLGPPADAGMEPESPQQPRDPGGPIPIPKDGCQASPGPGSPTGWLLGLLLLVRRRR